ncbi:hypothetical protein F5887DRAFT_1213931 [Amanita rubescens]|nr:hypothetical protein F5887DRAFT_1213931 [Amanita rubescens]
MKKLDTRRNGSCARFRRTAVLVFSTCSRSGDRGRGGIVVCWCGGGERLEDEGISGTGNGVDEVGEVEMGDAAAPTPTSRPIDSSQHCHGEGAEMSDGSSNVARLSRPALAALPPIPVTSGRLLPITEREQFRPHAITEECFAIRVGKLFLKTYYVWFIVLWPLTET